MSATIMLALAFTLVGDAQVVSGRSDGMRFQFHASQCNGDFRSEWRSPEGLLVAEEELNFDGDLWSRYHLQRRSIGQDILAIRESDGIVLIIGDGETRKSKKLRSERMPLVGPQLVEHLSLQLKRIRKRETIEFDYLIPEHALVLSLRAMLDHPPRSNETVVRVDATSIFMRTFVPETLLAYDESGRLISMTGRLLPQVGDSTSPVAIDGILRVKGIGSTCP